MTAARPRRWRRRLLWFGLLLVLLRLALALALPWLVDLGAGFAGLSARYGSGSLSLFGLALQFDDLELRDRARPDAEPLVRCARLRVDGATRALLRGALAVDDVTLTGVSVRLTRDATGAWQLPAAGATAAGPAAAPPAATAATPAEPRTFDLPIALGSLRVHDLSVSVTTHTADGGTASTETWLLDLSVQDLGHPDRPGRIDVRLHDRSRLDHVALRATAALAGDRADLTFAVTARGLRLASPLLDPICAPFGPRAHQADAELRGRCSLQSRAAPASLAIDAELEGTLALDGVEAAELRATAGPGTADSAVPFALRLAIPRLVQDLSITAGELGLGEAIAVRGTLAGTGIALETLRPWLAARGVEWPPSADLSARFAFGEDGGRLSASVQDFVWRAGDQTVALPRAELVGLTTNGGELAIEALRGDGPRLAVTHSPDGGLELGGIRLRPPPAAPGAPPAAQPAAPAPAAALPTVRVGALDWRGLALVWRDAHKDPVAELRVEDLELSGQGLALACDAPPGTALVRAAVPGIAERFEGTLRLAPVVGGADLELAANARGLTLAQLAPWFAPLGIAPAWQSAALDLSAQASVRAAPAGVQATAALRDLRLLDGPTELLRIDRAGIDGVDTTPGGAPYGTLELGGVRVAVERRDAAHLRIAGVDLLLPGPDEPGRWQVALDAGLSASAAGTRTFDLGLGIEGLVDRTSLRGTLRRQGSTTAVDAALAVTGLRGRELGWVLPPGVEARFTDGSLAATLAATADATNGALTIDLQQLALRDGTRELGAVDAVQAQVLEASTARLHIGRIAVRGVRAAAAIDPAGFEVLGLYFGTAPPPPPAAAAVRMPPPPAVAPREVRLDAFEWDATLRLQDRTADAEPLVATATARLLEPWRDDADPDEAPPLQLRLEAGAAPICRALAIDLRVQPFLLDPALSATLVVEGLDTTAIPRVLPSLRPFVDGRATAASLRAKAAVELHLRRRTPTVFDFGKPFGATLHLEDVWFGDADGEPFAAVPEAELSLRSIDAATGDVFVRRIEIVDPEVRATRTADGLEFGGMLLRTPPAPANAEPRPAPSAAPAGEVAIDLLRLQGLRLDLRDTTTAIPTHLPIAGLGVELRGFTTRALREAVPFTFDVELEGGDLELDRRVASSSLLAGVVKSTGAAVALQRNQHEREQRRFVEEVTAKGRLTLYPVPVGEISARVDAFELQTLRGLAAGSGIEIADGMLDLAAEIELRGAAGGRIATEPVFTHLSISEPPGGPISTYLRLPAPLDTVLFLLKNDAGEHRLPILVRPEGQRIDAETIRDSAVEAIALLIADAIGSTPMRAISTLTGFFGLTGPADLEALACTATFATGATTPDLARTAELAEVLLADPQRRLVLRHEPGSDDAARVAAMANPPQEHVHRSIAELRRQRAGLLREREPIAARLFALLAAARVQDSLPLQHRLQDLDHRLGALEATLDDLLGMLAETGERAAARRTRAALRDLGEIRLRAVRDLFRPHLGADTDRRIELRAPRTGAREGPGHVQITVR